VFAGKADTVVSMSGLGCLPRGDITARTAHEGWTPGSKRSLNTLASYLSYPHVTNFKVLSPWGSSL